MASMVLFQHENRCLWPSWLPLRGKIAVAARKVVYTHLCVTRQMGFDLILPEVEAFRFWNPARGRAKIGDNKLNRTRRKNLADKFVG